MLINSLKSLPHLYFTFSISACLLLPLSFFSLTFCSLPPSLQRSITAASQKKKKKANNLGRKKEWERKQGDEKGEKVKEKKEQKVEDWEQ